jgi:hypothetical protein
MSLHFRTELTRRLGDSLVEIDKLRRAISDRSDPKHGTSQQKLNAHLERQKCIEKLLEIESILDGLEREK